MGGTADSGTVDGTAPAGTGAGRAVGCGRSGAAGLAAISASVIMTIAIAIAGSSVMEPGLPGVAGQPPWAFALRLSPYVAVTLTAAAIAAGTLGLALCLRAMRRGWGVPPWAVLAAGIAAAVALALVPPFGSADHLSYAAYGRMVVTGHDPYTTTPAVLARLGDPVARAVQDWQGSPSVYGSLATGGQALASWIGGTSVRLTVFVLSLLNVAAFTGTGLALHRLTRGKPARQLRAGLLWTFNPLLLQVLVGGAHLDSQAIVFGVAAIAVATSGLAGRARPGFPLRRFGAGAAAGAVAGLGFAVKLTMVLIPAGLLVAAALAWWPRRGVRTGPEAERLGGFEPWRMLVPAAGGIAAGFAVTAAAAFIPWGLESLRPALKAGSYVSIGSPWRLVRDALHPVIGEATANDLVRAGAVIAVLVLVAAFARPLLALAARGSRGGTGPGPAAFARLAAAGAFVFVFAWLMAWPYVLPWYDGLAWALLALLPTAGRPWAQLEWLLLARTTALAFGYLPARGIAMPAGLDWLQTVVRTGVTPAALLAVTVALVMLLWPPWGAPSAPERVPPCTAGWQDEWHG